MVTGEESRTAEAASEKTWLQSFYFFDPDGIMLEFCATLQPGLPNADLPVNAAGVNGAVVSILMKGDFESFRLDTLVGFAVKCVHTVSIDAA